MTFNMDDITLSDSEKALIENIVSDNHFSLIGEETIKPNFLVSLLAKAMKEEAVQVICTLSYYLKEQEPDLTDAEKLKVLESAISSSEELFQDNNAKDIHKCLSNIFKQKVPDNLCRAIDDLGNQMENPYNTEALGDLGGTTLVEAC